MPHPTSGNSRNLPAIGALVAGGSSRRMGIDKADLRLGNRPLAAWAADALMGAAEVCVQVGGRPIAGVDWTVVADRRPDCGPAAGIETALLHFPGAVVLVCAVDTPFVPVALLQHAHTLLADGMEAAVPRIDERWHPLAAAYSPRILPPLSDWLDAGGKRLQQFLDTRHVARIDAGCLRQFGQPSTLLLNVNTREQFARAQAMVIAARDG